MRVFLIWNGNGPHVKILMKKLKDNSHELIYWVGPGGGEKNKSEGVIFHSRSDAIYGLPANEVVTADFLPPDKKIIDQLYQTESIILTMLNNANDRKGIHEHRHFYYKLLRYWLGVFNRYRPEVIIFPNEPHSVYAYIIYGIAKLFSVKTLFFSETRVSDRMLFMNDSRKGSSVLHQEIKNKQNKNFALGDLSDDLQEYYQRRAILRNSGQPLYVDFLKRKYSLAYRFSFAKIKSSIQDGTIVNKIFNFIFKQKGLMLLVESLKKSIYLFKPNLKKEYINLQVVLDLSQKFIYAPLQVQPERSTTPAGDIFVDQILMLEILSATLPEGWKIYVKEHPIQWIRKGLNYSNSRYPGYYQQISQIKNVQLIPVETDSYALIDKAQVVVTVSGAPGWEAIIRSKPAIVFGYPWYRDCPGVFNVNSVELCRNVLKTIKEGFAVDQQAVINYLKSFDMATIHGYIADSNEKSSKLTKEKNMEIIAEAIVNNIKK